MHQKRIQILVKNDKISKKFKTKWNNYYHKLYKGHPIRGIGLDDIYLHGDSLCCRITTQSGEKNALRKMKIRKSFRLEDMLIEVWKCVKERGII